MPGKCEKNLAEFRRVFQESGSICKAKEAAGWTKGQASKGRKGLPIEFLAVVEGTEAFIGIVGSPVNDSKISIIAPPKEKLERVYSPEFIAQQAKPGQTTNPNGYSKNATLASAAKDVIRRQADTFTESIASIITSGKYDSDKIGAFRELRDTGEGKPTQRIAMSGIICMIPAESGLDAWADDPE